MIQVIQLIFKSWTKKKKKWKKVQKTFQEVANEGQTMISVRWLVTKKNKRNN